MTEADLRLLDEYRLSFGPSYQEVTGVLRERPPRMKPTGRFPKTTGSIVDKLKRESIRLTQIQDIVGCRIVVPRLEDQIVSEVIIEVLFHEANVRTIRPTQGSESRLQGVAHSCFNPRPEVLRETQGRLVELRTFDQSERALAESERFELELVFSRAGIEREVVPAELLTCAPAHKVPGAKAGTSRRTFRYTALCQAHTQDTAA